MFKSLKRQFDREVKRDAAKEARERRREKCKMARQRRREERKEARLKTRRLKEEMRQSRALARATFRFLSLDAKINEHADEYDLPELWQSIGNRLAQRVKRTDSHDWFYLLVAIAWSIFIVLVWIFPMSPVEHSPVGIRALYCIGGSAAISILCAHLIPYQLIKRADLAAEAELYVASIAHPDWIKQRTTRFTAGGGNVVLREVHIVLGCVNNPVSPRDYATAYLCLKTTAGLKETDDVTKRRTAEMKKASADR